MRELLTFCRENIAFFDVPIDDMYQQWEGQFEEWFADVKSQLSGDVAGNLLHRIELAEDKIEAVKKEIFYQMGDWVVKQSGNLVELNYSKIVNVGLSQDTAVNLSQLRVEKVPYPFVLSKILFYETIYGENLVNITGVTASSSGIVDYYYRNDPFTCLTRTCELAIRTSTGIRDESNTSVGVYIPDPARGAIPVSIRIIGVIA